MINEQKIQPILYKKVQNSDRVLRERKPLEPKCASLFPVNVRLNTKLIKKTQKNQMNILQHKRIVIKKKQQKQKEQIQQQIRQQRKNQQRKKQQKIIEKEQQQKQREIQSNEAIYKLRIYEEKEKQKQKREKQKEKIQKIQLSRQQRENQKQQQKKQQIKKQQKEQKQKQNLRNESQKKLEQQRQQKNKYDNNKNKANIQSSQRTKKIINQYAKKAQLNIYLPQNYYLSKNLEITRKFQNSGMKNSIEQANFVKCELVFDKNSSEINAIHQNILEKQRLKNISFIKNQIQQNIYKKHQIKVKNKDIDKKFDHYYKLLLDSENQNQFKHDLQTPKKMQKKENQMFQIIMCPVQNKQLSKHKKIVENQDQIISNKLFKTKFIRKIQEKNKDKLSIKQKNYQQNKKFPMIKMDKTLDNYQFLNYKIVTNSKSKELILSWLMKFQEVISRQFLSKQSTFSNLSLIMQKINQIRSSTHSFPNVKQKDSAWNEYLLEILKDNNFQRIHIKLQVQNTQMKEQDEDLLLNCIFFKHPYKPYMFNAFQEKSIYLFSEQIEITYNSYLKRCQIIIGYTVNDSDKSLELILIGFIQLKTTYPNSKDKMIQQKNQKYQKFIKKQSSIYKFNILITKCLQNLEYKNVKFILNSFNQELMISLEQMKIKVKQDFGKRISFLLHTEALISYVQKNTFDDYRSQFNQKLYRKLIQTNCVKQYEKYVQDFKLLFLKPFSSIQKNISQLNPRVMFQIFNHLSKFISLDHQNTPNFIALSFLSKYYYYKNQSLDQVNLIIKMLSLTSKINKYPKLIVYLLTIFKLTNKRQSFIQNCWQENTIIRNQSFLKNKILENLFSNHLHEVSQQQNNRLSAIIQNPVHQFRKIMEKCPKQVFIIILRLINFTKQLEVFQQKEIKDKLVTSVKVNNRKNKNITQIFMEKQHLQIQLGQQRDRKYKDFKRIEQINKKSYENSELQQQNRPDKSQKWGKVWYCECKFYLASGIPCDHEIFCCLSAKTSVFAEISKKWKFIKKNQNTKNFNMS